MDDVDIARRLVFVMAKVARRFGMPQKTRPEILLECSMQDPERVTNEEFAAVYAAWKLLDQQTGET